MCFCVCVSGLCGDWCGACGGVYNGFMTLRVPLDRAETDYGCLRYRDGVIAHSDCWPVMQNLPPDLFDLVYADPPFNTARDFRISGELGELAYSDKWSERNGEGLVYAEHLSRLFIDLMGPIEQRAQLNSNIGSELLRVCHGAKVAFGQVTSDARDKANADAAFNYLLFMAVRLLEMYRVLRPNGTLFLHCDPKFGPYLRLMLDLIFGRDGWINEIIWHYSLGGYNTTTHFPRKHDTIYMYRKPLLKAPTKATGTVTGEDQKLVFDKPRRDDVDDVRRNTYPKVDDQGRRYTVRRNAAGEKVRYYMKGGKTIDSLWINEDLPHQEADLPFVEDVDVFDYSFSNTKSERTGYPTQKPLHLLKLIILTVTNKGDYVLDPFCGSGTTLVTARDTGRYWFGIDESDIAVEYSKGRLLAVEKSMLEHFAFPDIVPPRYSKLFSDQSQRV